MVQWPRWLSSWVVSVLLVRVAAGIVETPEAHGNTPLSSPWSSILLVEPESVHELTKMLAEGTNLVCCGHWRHDAARVLQERVAEELRVPTRRLGDVHLANASANVRSGGPGGWEASAVLYLDEPEDAAAAQVTLAVPAAGARGGELSDPVAARRGTVILVPDGGQILHSSPRQVAFLRIRRDGAAGGASRGRNAFEYYFSSWVRKNFVAPYDTGAQMQFFRNHTSYPRYWHGFVWSFLGMFSTVFACFPLAWWGVQLVERVMQSESELLSETAAKVMSVPGTPTKPPTLLPRLGADARSLQHYVPQKPGGGVNHLLQPPDAKIGASGRTAADLSPEDINLATSLLYRSSSN